MTNTTNTPAKIELDKLEALARAATPGPWAYQEDSDAYTHIIRPVASPGWIIASATQTSKPEGEANGRWIAAANPATVLQLIALARAVQPAPDYCMNDRDLARHILAFMGHATTGGNEPGADPLADRLAEKLAGWIRPAPAVSEQADERALMEAECAKRYSDGDYKHTSILMRLSMERDAFRAGWQARASLAQRASSAPDWHAAVLTECMRIESAYHANDPARTLKDLIDWYVQEASGVAEGIKVMADNYMRLTCGASSAPADSAVAAHAGALLAALRDAHDALEGMSDSDIDHFEDDEEERECAPAQYAARKVMEAIQNIERTSTATPASTQPADMTEQAALDAALRQEVITMYQLLDDGEWAEHVAGTPHGQCLETAITRLVGKAASAQPVAAAPAEPFAYAICGIDGRGKHFVRDIKEIPRNDKEEAWKMDDDGLGEYWAGNAPLYRAAPASPVVEAPARWKLVPVEPTDEMRESCKHLAYADHIDEDWSAMVAAAPATPVAAAPTLSDERIKELTEFIYQHEYDAPFGYDIAIARAIESELRATPAAPVAQPSLDAVLSCYSLDDTVHDYQDKIRVLYAAPVAQAKQEGA